MHKLFFHLVLLSALTSLAQEIQLDPFAKNEAPIVDEAKLAHIQLKIDLLRMPRDFANEHFLNVPHDKSIADGLGAFFNKVQEKAKDFTLVYGCGISSRSGQTGRFDNVREYIYPISFNPPSIPKELPNQEELVNEIAKCIKENKPLPAWYKPTPKDFQMMLLGININARSDWDEPDKLLNIAIKITLNQLQKEVNYGGNLMPQFHTRDLSTKLQLHDKQSVVVSSWDAPDFVAPVESNLVEVLVLSCVVLPPN